MGARRKRKHVLRPHLVQGFTLLEVTLALLILAGSLVTLLGLQSSAVQRTIHDDFVLQAMLHARRILSAIEASKEPIQIQDTSGAFREVLQHFMPLEAESESELRSTERYQARVQVEYWGIPDLDPQAMKRIILTLAWGDSSLDRFQVFYFIPFDEDKPQEEEEL